MKVAVITLHAIKNYGSVLQTLATQELFQSLGCEVEIINYLREDSQDKNVYARWTRGDNPIKKLMKSIVLVPTAQRWKKVFWGFLNENVNLTKKMYLSESELEIDTPVADIYCTGSDQVWNSDWNQGFEEPFYLKFVPNGKKKIAYAASIGRDGFAEWEIPQVKELLSQYSTISVREDNAVDILNGIGIQGSVCVPDPTLCMTKEYWEKKAGPRMIDKPYVLIYQLNYNRQFDDFAVKFAKKKGLELVRLCTRYDQIRLPGKHVILPKVEGFISLIKDADYVVTDSFHATAFSLNLNTEIISIYPNDFSSRLASILKKTGLETRHLKSYDQFNIADTPIDFERVNKCFDKERKMAIEWLEAALSMEKEINE